MGNIQKINLDGTEYVILSSEDYEDLVDGIAASEAKARIAAGKEELYPLAIAEALIAGEQPVRVFRKHRGLTHVQLAEKAGVSAPYISEIETGKKAGSFEVMAKIARALNVSLDELAPNAHSPE